MEHSFQACVLLELEPSKITGKSKHIATSIVLEPSKNLIAGKYRDEKGLPTPEGAGVLTVCLIQGLLANIHSCHEKGYRDSAEHLRYIISELERGFVEVAEVTDSYMQIKPIKNP